MAAIKLALATLLLVAATSGDKCDSTTCVISKNCRCLGDDIPGGLAPKDTPQMIFLAFDDGLTKGVFPYYNQTISGRKNPNGCPITMTFFLTHQYTEYDKVSYMWTQGNEFASNSISKLSNITYWRYASEQDWKNEMVGMKNFIYKYSRIYKLKGGEVKGMRAPYLQMGADNMFKMASSDNNFQWDSSWPTLQYALNPIWPYTLDFNTDTTRDCPIEGCPTQNYPGFWEVPLVDLFSLHNGTACAQPHSCTPLPTSKQETIDFLNDNFERFYSGNRAPFGLFLGASWFEQVKEGRQYIFDGYLEFLDNQLKRPEQDVYVLTVSQGLEWIKNPTPLSKLKGFEPWNCDVRRFSHCQTSFPCHWDSTPAPGPRNMISCIPCPEDYPWVQNLTKSSP